MIRALHLIRALSKTERLILLGAALIFFLSGAIKLVFFIQDNTDLVAARGGIFREGIIGQPVFINPILPTTDADRDMARLVFSSAYDVAESIKVSEEGKVWTVRIRENVFWHDGERLTSDDILFSLDVIQDRESRSHLFSMFQGVTAERISELEVKFNLQTTYAFFAEEHLKNLGIIPEHIFNEIPVQNFIRSIYGLNPIGSGPYKISSHKKDDKGIITSLALIKNEAYFEGEPNISEIIFKYYRNEGEIIKAYNLGQIDAFGLSSAESLSLTEDQSIGSLIRHNLYSPASSRYYALFINQSLSPAELKDVKVRKALSMAIDKDVITNSIFGSHAVNLHGPTTLTVKENEEFDSSILEGLTLNITVPEERFLIRTAEMVKDMWMTAGATVNIIIAPLKQVEEKILRNTDYEILLFGNITGSSQDLFSFWHSSRRFYPDQNLALYQNKKIDALLEDYRKEAIDQNKTEKLKIISDAIAYDYPAIFLYSPDYIYITTPNLHGFNDRKIINTSADRFQNSKDWYVKTKRVF